MRKKFSIIGAGQVGGTAAFIAALRELGDIVIVNRTAGMAQGKALDIAEASPILGFDSKVIGTGNYSEIKNSDIVIITSGLQRTPGMSREELLNKNAEIIKDVCANVKKYANKAILIVVTNPLDAMVYAAMKFTRFPKQRLIGMAGTLDSSRFRSFIAMELGVSVKDIYAMVLGSHGDLMVPLTMYCTVAGIPLTELLPKEKIEKIVERTRNAGAEILDLEKESSAFYAPGAAIIDIVEAIAHDKKRILPCAAYLEGEYGIKGIFLGVPALIGSNGIERVIELKLNKEESDALRKSADAIKELLKDLKI